MDIATPEEEFGALVRLARAIDSTELPDDIDNYVLTLSGTVAVGVRVIVRPRALDE